MTATLIDGKAIAARMRAETLLEAQALAAAGWEPMLVSISVGDVAAAELYVRNQQKQAEAAGVGFESRNYPESISLEQLVGVLSGLTVVAFTWLTRSERQASGSPARGSSDQAGTACGFFMQHSL